MRKRPTHIEISIVDLTARNGAASLVFRCTEEDKADLDAAADLLTMSTAQFIRMIVIQAARKVLAEANVVEASNG